jgi:hypothetical protein
MLNEQYAKDKNMLQTYQNIDKMALESRDYELII